MVFNTILFFYNNRFSVSICKSLLKKIIVDAQSLIETKKNHIDAKRKEISEVLLRYTKNNGITYNQIENYLSNENLSMLLLFQRKNLSMLLEIIINFCELVDHHKFEYASRKNFIESQSEVPPEMKEAIASLCYVGACYSELPDLQKLMSQFSIKYGEEFIANLADCGVKQQVIELLQITYPPVQERNKLLKEIADEFHINWDPIKRRHFQLMK